MIASLVLAAALTGCAPAPPPTVAGAPLASSRSPSAAPTPVAEPPIVDSAPQPVRAPVPPVQVLVASAGIDMEVTPVGVESGGFMQLPADPAVAGWYRFGPDPWSADGNTVLAAHIDAPEYPIGPFAALRDLPAGTEIVVSGADGRTVVYGIESVTYYPKQELPTEALFARTGTRSLVLITCGGAFDTATGHYADNVVAVATRRA